MVEVVTVANFADLITANLAKQELEVEGITAFLANEMTVNIAWHLTVAVRWIKLQVPEPEVEQALSILAATSIATQSVPYNSDETTPEQTLSANSEEEFQSTLDSEDDDDVVRRSWADRTVERMFRAAVLGLGFLPLQLYSLWLLIRLLVAHRRVSQSRYRQAAIAIIFAILWMIFSTL